MNHSRCVVSNDPLQGTLLLLLPALFEKFPDARTVVAELCDTPSGFGHSGFGLLVQGSGPVMWAEAI
jgi:hypothetical protein